MSTLKVTVSKRANGYVGSVSIPGLQTTRLARKDGSTEFSTTSALKTVGNGLAKRLGLTAEFAEAQRKAAKKSIKQAK